MPRQKCSGRGTAYIREMYDRYGARGFLAAYNAAPDRVDGYLAGAADLTDETGELPRCDHTESRQRRAAAQAAGNVCIRPPCGVSRVAPSATQSRRDAI